MSKTLDDEVARYYKAAHAMQSGVKFKMENVDVSETSPKMLRTGVNASMVELGALVKILIDKGIITDELWYKELADMMEAEVKKYETNLTIATGHRVVLG